jgi:DNA-binding transcriptional MerR regulator
LAQVPTKTLRYYDEIGLFIPADVDPWTGYRRYGADQLPRLHRLRALKGLGFTLDDVGRLLAEELDVAELRRMLMLRRTQIERQRAEAETRLAEIEIRLRQIEQEKSMTDLDVLTKTLPAIMVVGARETVPSAELMRERCMALHDLTCEFISCTGLRVTGPSFALYYPSDEGIDVEMAYAVNLPERHNPKGTDQPARLHELPATTVAYALFAGSYDDFGGVGRLHVALKEWVAATGRTSTEPVRELYLQPPSNPTDRYGVMELQYPLS